MTYRKTPFPYLGLLSAFSLLVFDLYQPALPAITRYFNTSHALGQLTLSLFFFVYGLSQMLWGPFIDHYGRRRTLRLSFLLFLLATLVCLVATNINLLIIGRILQGFAVCCSNVVAVSCSRDEEDSTARARLLSHISMIVSVSPIFAPMIGSLIFVTLGWREIFIFMLVLGVVLMMLGKLFLREAPHWKRPKKSLTLKASLAAYKELLTHKYLWMYIAIVSASYSCVMIAVVNISYLMIDNLKVSPLMFSLFFASNGVIIILGNFIGIRLREYRSLSWNICCGSLLMVAGSLLMIALFFQEGLQLSSLAPLLLINFGVTLVNAPAFALAIANYKERAGTATALIYTVRTCLSAAMASIIGGFIIYRIDSLPVSLLFCSLICMMVSVAGKHSDFEASLVTE